MDYSNIKHINNRYYIIKTVYNREICYGSYKYLEDALTQREKLKKHSWKKNKTTGYPEKECFPKYQIRNIDENYLIINCKNGRIYGEYKCKIYAKLIKKILPFYSDEVNINKIENIALKEFYKYIMFDKIKNRYIVVYKGIYYYTTSNIIDALKERDIILKHDGDFELMCEDPTVVYDYTKEELPPYPQVKNITYVASNKKYQIRKRIRNETIVINNIPYERLAILIRDFLKNNQWNKKIMSKMVNVANEIIERNKYIQLRNNKFYVEKTTNKKRVNYATYNDLELARYVRNKLLENSWDIRLVKNFERDYIKYNIQTRYYYDNTDILASI